MTEHLTPAQRVGRQVRLAMIEQGKTQNDIAAILGLTHQAVSRRMLGDVAFRSDELIAIGEWLGVQPSRFLRPIPRPRKPAGAEHARDPDDDVDAEGDRARPRVGAA